MDDDGQIDAGAWVYNNIELIVDFFSFICE